MAASSSSSSAVDFPSSLYCSSDSTSAQVHPRKYGVFLNFRGKDTREGFVSFLYRAVKDRGILAYLDSVELEKGADISTIVDAIPDSNIAVVVFSKEYASSSFCLDELVKIMECRQTTGLQLLVVFCRVDPEVENQTGSFSGDFDNHQQSYDEQKIARWRTALKNAAFVGGWDYNSKDIRDEAALVDKIVKDICKKLRRIYPSNYLEGLVGMHSRVEEIESLLCIEKVNEVRFVGIWGMGGIDNTTLARAIFEEAKKQPKREKLRSRNVLEDTNARLAKVELAMADGQEKFEIVDQRINELEKESEELREELQGASNQALSMCLGKVKILEETLHCEVGTLKEEFERVSNELKETKDELVLCKKTIAQSGSIALPMIVSPSLKVDVPSPKAYNGSRNAEEIENFLWNLEQYFKALGIIEDAKKIDNTAIYLMDTAIVW